LSRASTISVWRFTPIHAWRAVLADALLAGDDERAKRTAMDLAGRMGLHAVDAGALRNAGALENIAVLWIQLAMSGGAERHFAFQIVGRA
jgi:predicted dinucleotide-binding enzyme